MTINRIGATANARPAEVQNTNETSRPESPRSPGHADLSPRVSNAPAASPPRVSRESVQQVQAATNEVNALLQGGGAALLQQGVQDGFRSLPPEARGLAVQTARLVGIGSAEPTSPTAPLSPASLLQRLDAVSAASSQPFVDLQQVKESSRVIAASLAKTPVADLLANREAVKEKLSTWVNQTEALHEQLKADGPTDPATMIALEARTQAAECQAKTLTRMAVGRLGRMAFDLTVGAVASTVRRFLGT
jgi:hypothetical protein